MPGKTFRPKGKHVIIVEERVTMRGIAGHPRETGLPLGTVATARRPAARGRLRPAKGIGIPLIRENKMENRFGVFTVKG
jgi:hypothetical protein